MHIVITSSMMISVFITDYLGRKNSLILGQVFILVGWIVLYFAPKFSILILGRCLMGLGAGIIYPVTTLYLSEISLVCFALCCQHISVSNVIVNAIFTDSF